MKFLCGFVCGFNFDNSRAFAFKFPRMRAIGYTWPTSQLAEASASWPAVILTEIQVSLQRPGGRDLLAAGRRLAAATLDSSTAAPSDLNSCGRSPLSVGNQRRFWRGTSRRCEWAAADPFSYSWPSPPLPPLSLSSMQSPLRAIGPPHQTASQSFTVVRSRTRRLAAL